MQYVQLGRTGCQVSRLCLGTMNFGPETTEPDSYKIMDRAHALGINFFDTADIYGWKQGEGITEQIIGRWFAQGGGRREKTILATKLFGKQADWPNHGRLSAVWIKRACEASLKRMQTDYIDLYQMHHVCREVTWEEIWQALEQLTREGKILYVGSSNFAAWNIVQANEVARQRNFLGLVSEQSKYSLLTRQIELEVLPACKAYGVGVIPWSPLAGGMLAGGTATAKDGRRAGDWVKKLYPPVKDKLAAYEKLCAALGAQPADVALAWMLANPTITAPIIGPRTLDQLDGALRALELKLSDETMQQLDEIFPGPGGQAPEAYAW